MVLGVLSDMWIAAFQLHDRIVSIDELCIQLWRVSHEHDVSNISQTQFLQYDYFLTSEMLFHFVFVDGWV